MLVSSVLGKSGLASPDAPIAGALSALRAPVARATGLVMVATVGLSTSDPLDELTKLLTEAFDVWDDIAGDRAKTPIRHNAELVPELTRLSDALVDVLPCVSRSPLTSPTVTSSASESLHSSTPIPQCRKSAEATCTFIESELFAAASLAIPPTAAQPEVSRESDLARMNISSAAAPRPHDSSDANTHGGRRQRGSRGSNSSRRRASAWRSP